MQIPRALLPDSMEVYKPDPESTRGGEYLEPVTIGHVRFERAEALNITDHALSDGASGRIWIDASNSDDPFEVPKGAKVVINGERLFVLTCSPYKIGKRLHHWELDVG